ncbi:MerR family transcriptional regulator [Paucilactobacillus hokkaidonensis JCM 18461]|uniref:MerR family transcriptional regulator n=2 Tax=Paucilactobacillus hokkaidonensis TaxID=1193095 RepID=A0A0A1GQZ4_9LACO|nr:MerR family transcriptional regulator [Paucilactobacillus hokkaidonensis]BAP84702.1 MerR family transcriptional regulator [Paucilactobacillus hokkaidonensis JCM 18461]
MTYTIKEVADKVGLSIYTLRFYDKEGLLPFVVRNQAGYREFTDGDLNLIHTICCLKNTGMKISEIRSYIEDVMAGPATIEHRKQILSAHRLKVVAEQQKIAENLEEIDYKLNIYSAPDANEQVKQELQYAVADKVNNHLENPYGAIDG